MIKVKGLQVAPAELEGLLLSHPDVVDAGVIGVPDEVAGELPCAFIVLRDETARVVSRNENASALLKASIQQVSWKKLFPTWCS